MAPYQDKMFEKKENKIIHMIKTCKFFSNHIEIAWNLSAQEIKRNVQTCETANKQETEK